MIRFNKPTIEKKDLESVLYCMIKDDLTPGNCVKTFSDLLSKELNLPKVTVLNNYFDSFEIIFHLIDASPGDEIILPSFARYSTLYAVIRRGLKPVLVDLDEGSLLPSQECIERCINSKVKALIIPQMFGLPYDLSQFCRFDLPLVEDLDGAIGAKINGKPIGSFGKFVTMKFNDYSIITTGDGGLLALEDRRLKIKMGKLFEESVLQDCIMSDFNASLGISQLNGLKKSIEVRRRIGEYYDNAVMTSGASLVGRGDGKELVYSSYVLKTEAPFEEVDRQFKRYGVPVKHGIEKPLHRYLNLDIKTFERTEEMFHRLIALPIYPTLRNKEVEDIAKGIRTIL